MQSRFALAFSAFLIALAFWSVPASAQDSRCGAWRAELARMGRAAPGVDQRAANQARRIGGQLSQAHAQYSALGCDRGGFLFFGSAAPPECGPLRQRIAGLQATYGGLRDRAEGRAPAYDQRRSELQAAIDAYCRPGVYQTPEPARPRNLFEALFGAPQGREIAPPMPELDGEPREVEDRGPRWGSGRPVCVRTCDGFFFPLPTGGRDGAEEMCQALCPATETRLFYMGRDGEVESAVGSDGESYASLPKAGQYLKRFDGACGCRKDGQSWSAALAEAEAMLTKRKGDMIVSAQKAEELSRPRETRRERDRKRAAEKPEKAVAADESPAVPLETPTSGKESSGIGPQTISDAGTVGAGQGQTLNVTGADGAARKVRIVAPALTPQQGGARP